MSATHRFLSSLTLLALMLPVAASAQEPETVSPSPATERQRPPAVDGATKISLDFADTSIYDLLKFFADLKRMNFVLGDPKDLQGQKVTIISQHPVTVDAGYRAFLSALEVSGYAITEAGGVAKVVKLADAAQAPIRIGRSSDIPYSDQVVTQLIQLENVSVSEVSKIVTSMVPGEAKVIAYAPTNTLIITDTGHNLRKVYNIVNELDVAAPKSSLKITPLSFADAADVKGMIEQLYGTEEAGASEPASRTSRSSSRSRRVRRDTSTPTTSEAVSAGQSSKYISKVLSDERTNSIVVLANEEGHAAVQKLLDQVDIDVDPQNRAQIHVVYLENAKAEDVAQVLSELSQGGASASSRNSRTNSRNANSRTSARGQAAAAPAPNNEEARGAIAAFDSGMRIAADENTNSLVIIANQEDYKVVRSVIDQLDVERRQVFVDAVILELSSEDTFDIGLAAHLPTQPSGDSVGFVGGQFGASSLGLSQDALTGLALGVFGQSVDVPINDPTGQVTSLSVPAFGIVLNALRTNSSVNIVSNPTLMTLDNEEAKIVVGRKIPFPTNASFNNITGQPIVSFQREDVAITLQLTPRINSSNLVTLEVELEVQEVEEDDQSLDFTQSGGPTTSKRQVQNNILVGDNQTVVLGGLVGATETEVETKFPVLGDLPLVGALFRGHRETSRKTNLLIFLTPHIIDDETDLQEVQRIKEAQRQEYLRRFYGKSRAEQRAELQDLLQYSMNFIDEPSMYRGPTAIPSDSELGGEPMSDETRAAIEEALEGTDASSPGAGAGDLPAEETLEIIEDESLPEESTGGAQLAPEGGN